MTTARYIAGAKDPYPALRAAHQEKGSSGFLRNPETSIGSEGGNINEYQADYSYGPWDSRDSDDSVDQTSKGSDKERTLDSTAATTPNRDASPGFRGRERVDKQLESRQSPSLAAYENVSIPDIQTKYEMY